MIYVIGMAAFAACIRHELIIDHDWALGWIARVFLIGYNPPIIDYGIEITYGLFVGLVFAALWARDATYRSVDRGVPMMLFTVAAGVLMAFVGITSIFGLVLLAAVPIYELLRYRTRDPFYGARRINLLD